MEHNVRSIKDSDDSCCSSISDPQGTITKSSSCSCISLDKRHHNESCVPSNCIHQHRQLLGNASMNSSTGTSCCQCDYSKPDSTVIYMDDDTPSMDQNIDNHHHHNPIKKKKKRSKQISSPSSEKKKEQVTAPPVATTISSKSKHFDKTQNSSPIQNQHRGNRRKCAIAKGLVYLFFLMIILGGIAAFFCWPRTPLVVVGSHAERQGPATTWATTPEKRPWMEATWLMNITLDNRDNFIPTRLTRMELTMVDSLTQNPFATAVLEDLAVPPKMLTVLSNTVFHVHYSARTDSDTTWQDLYRACGPKQASERPSLNINMKIVFHFLGIIWTSTVNASPPSDTLPMSIARALVDIIGVASSTTKIGYGVIATQSAALQQHLKTSSLVNPTPTIVQSTLPDHSSQATDTLAEHGLDTSTSANHSAMDAPHGTLDAGLPPVQDSVTAPIEATATTTTTTTTIVNEPPTTTQASPTIEESISKQQQAEAPSLDAQQPEQVLRRQLKEARIPTSRAGRLWHYGSLATGMGLGAINESFRRATGLSKDQQGSVMLSEKNVDRLVEKLSTMRGAALKMGQMLSIQGIQASNQSSSALPPQLEQVLLRVHDSANYMPKRQMEKVMADELGKNWLSNFEEFDPIPIAAASIGQVHAATLASNGKPVVIKIQYPGVATSIDSDLSNLKALVTFSNLLPRGLYLDNTIKVTKQELAWECDYLREASNAQRFQQLLKDDSRYKVPHVIEDLSTARILVSERLNGQVLSKATEEPQEIRNKLGENLLRLCLREVFSFQFMQTDPNWSNFFYNRQTGQIELLDFGACREFPSTFLQLYGRILGSAVRQDREGVWEYSKQLGFVTGYETDVMKQAHIDSVMVLGEPFAAVAPDLYDFTQQTITSRVRETIPVMLQHRLTPPPDESYGLHKKLSGAFLLCTKLGSKFDTKSVWKEEVESHFRF